MGGSMAKRKSLMDEVGDRLGIPETVKSDNSLRWDGSKLYVLENVYRGDTKSGQRKRDVSDEVVAYVKRLAKGSK